MYNLYAIYDAQTKLHTLPVPIESDRDAIHAFKLQCNTPKTPYHDFPEDYTLLKIGTYDQRTGIVAKEEHSIIATASKLKDQ